MGSPSSICYLTASVLFVLGLKGLTHPRTAVRGNLLGAIGMLLAVAVTLLDRDILSYAGSSAALRWARSSARCWRSRSG